MNVSVISSKGQVVIPKDIREKLKVKPGDKVMLSMVDNHAEMQKVPEDIIDSLCGILSKHPKSLSNELLKDRRKDKAHENR